MFQDGDILLCKGNDFFSRLIKWGTRSQYSHVAVVASAKLDLIIEAIPGKGVRAISIKNYTTPYDLYRVKSVYPFKSPEVTAYLIQELTKGYDFKSVFILGWEVILKRLKFKSRKNKQISDQLPDEPDYFCSELCYEAFFFAGLDIVPEVDSALMTSPADIANSKILEVV
jgi:uncharacterized protein YycO